MKNQRELAIVVSKDNKIATGFESIKAIKDAGFHNVFIQWYKEEQNFNQERLEYIRKLGLNVIFAHLDFLGINSIWEDGEEGDSIVEEYKTDIKACKENDIALVVMHLTVGTSVLPFNELGLSRLKRIVSYAKGLGVRITFENTRIKGYLEYVLSNITDENVGICFDTGHCHAHFKDNFDFEFYKDRIFAVHLHDNHGLHDEHLIPYDGTIDWDWMIEGLKKGHYSGPITLECVYDNQYLEISPEAFFQKAYETGLKLRDKF
jgi:sugar phosphate isomerase/epimerase